jgi:hypothetical protein
MCTRPFSVLFFLSQDTPEIFLDGRPVTSIGSVIKQFGLVPLIGSAALIAVSKELVVIDAHFVHGVNFVLWTAIAYASVGDSIFKAMRDLHAAEIK